LFESDWSQIAKDKKKTETEKNKRKKEKMKWGRNEPERAAQTDRQAGPAPRSTSPLFFFLSDVWDPHVIFLLPPSMWRLPP
jgi:hypothetical protein